MLSFPTIIERYPPEIVARLPRAILVEYLQHEILDSLYQQKGSEHLSFIGGTAIRIVYGSQRFSEDLDFDNFGLSFSDFDDLIKLVVADMQHKGFQIEFRLVEKGAYHCYIKFPDILSVSGLPHKAEEKILVRLDTVRKEKFFEPRIHKLSAFDVYRDILCNPPEVLLAQKLVTIIQRKREKGRDLYDCSFLFGRYDPDYDYMQKQFNLDKTNLIKELNARLSGLDLEQMANDVLPFLIRPDDRERVLSFREYITQKLT